MVMDQSHPVDLGQVNNLVIMRKPGVTENFLVVGQSAQGGRWARIITKGAAQALWFHLTHILYPRAAEQITPRAETAVLKKSDAPSVTGFLEVRATQEEPQIHVRGLGGHEEWVIHFSTDEGYELWAALEKVLKAV